MAVESMWTASQRSGGLGEGCIPSVLKWGTGEGMYPFSIDVGGLEEGVHPFSISWI